MTHAAFHGGHGFFTPLRFCLMQKKFDPQGSFLYHFERSIAFNAHNQISAFVNFQNHRCPLAGIPWIDYADRWRGGQGRGFAGRRAGPAWLTFAIRSARMRRPGGTGPWRPGRPATVFRRKKGQAHLCIMSAGCGATGVGWTHGSFSFPTGSPVPYILCARKICGFSIE